MVKENERMGLSAEEMEEIESMADMDEQFMFGQQDDHEELFVPEAASQAEGLRPDASAWIPQTANLAKVATDLEASLSVSQQHKQRLTVIQADPNSRLHAVKSFADLGLSAEIMKGVYEMCFDQPSRIQAHSLPMILADPPLPGIFQAQSGSGKTVAFALGMLSRCDPQVQECQALCISPTRELADQTMTVLETMGKHTGLSFRRAMQGYELERGTKVNEQVIVGTPGKVENWIKKKVLGPSTFRIFVLDEADLLSSKSGNKSSTKGIVKALPRTCQLLLFSATFAEETHRFCKMVLSKQTDAHGGRVNEIRINSDEELVLAEIKQFKMDTRTSGKMDVLTDIYSVLDLHMSIIFVTTKATADKLTVHMEEMGFAVSKLHGNLAGAERDQVMNDFRSFQTKVLITTNVLARGVDVPGVNLVINYDPPCTAEGLPDCENYLHRIGRCGRFGRKGVAISFVGDLVEDSTYSEVEKHFGTQLSVAPADDVEALGLLVEATLGA
jgi:ATP-dependent RNA helicase DDX19/DBP5